MSDYIDGELAPRQQRRLEAHARLCPDCGRLRRSLTVLVWELRELGRVRSSGPTVVGGVIERLRREPLPGDSGGPAPRLP
jgi:Putative zinc-finger